MTIAKAIEELELLVNDQAEDVGIWFSAKTAPEAFLQEQIRLLHDAAERVVAALRSQAEPVVTASLDHPTARAAIAGIELAQRNAALQAQGEPVAWRSTLPGGHMPLYHETEPHGPSTPEGCEVQPLYASPRAVPEGYVLVPWVPLSDEDRTKAFNRLPGGLDGFLKTWGWLHYAKEIERLCMEKNAAAKEGSNG